MISKCPCCSSTKYENGCCMRCGFVNKKLNKEDYINIEDEKQEKRQKRR